jgi:hypothetical protein
MVRCEVRIGDESSFGTYANAFRIVPDNEQEVFLDFCVYSARTDTAQVVSRVRVAVAFLPTIQERLAPWTRECPPARNALFLINPTDAGEEN